MSAIVFITGATSGIGKACAYTFAGAGYSLILCGRRYERLQEIEKDLRQRFQIQTHIMALDVRNRDAVADAITGLPDEWSDIGILINNAGLALGLSNLGEGNIDEWEQMIDTNVKGLLYVSRAVIPGMKLRGKGHIINIGSIAGRETYPKGNVYCASKHAVAAITKGMRIDHVADGIKVSQVSPGAVETEFSLIRFHGDADRAKSVYKGFKPLMPEDVASAILFVASQPDHVNIDDLLLMPASQASATIFHR